MPPHPVDALIMRLVRDHEALATPADVAARIAAFRDAGVRHVILDLVGPSEERGAQLERFASEVRPLL